MRATLLMLALMTAPLAAQTPATKTPATQTPVAQTPLAQTPAAIPSAPPVGASMVAPAAPTAVSTAVVTVSAPTMLKPAPERAGDGTQPRQRLVTVFGTEECPKPSSPDEIVVCARLPDSEAYRIPERLRQAEKRVSPLQANRNLLLGDATGGAGGSIGSCSAVGSGGMIGCDRKQIDAWARDRTNRMGTDEKNPR